MITSFFHQARFWPTLWRGRLTWWLADAKDNLPFLAMIALPIIGVAGIICIACVNATRVDPIATQTISREERLARRREVDLQCLAENVYFEARGEPLKGQYAVAEVTLNRTRAPNFPHTVCGVVHEMRWDPSRKRNVADFSWTELGGLAAPDGPAWKRAMTVATAVYDDDTPDLIVPDALFYHSTSVRPGWARTRSPVAKIGNHVFYR